ncbi:MAG: hypothetical protein AAF153_02685 [Pseudomonadota bacterium]
MLKLDNLDLSNPEGNILGVTSPAASIFGGTTPSSVGELVDADIIVKLDSILSHAKTKFDKRLYLLAVIANAIDKAKDNDLKARLQRYHNQLVKTWSMLPTNNELARSSYQQLACLYTFGVFYFISGVIKSVAKDDLQFDSLSFLAIASGICYSWAMLKSSYGFTKDSIENDDYYQNYFQNTQAGKDGDLLLLSFDQFTKKGDRWLSSYNHAINKIMQDLFSVLISSAVCLSLYVFTDHINNNMRSLYTLCCITVFLSSSRLAKFSAQPFEVVNNFKYSDMITETSSDSSNSSDRINSDDNLNGNNNNQSPGSQKAATPER